MPDGADESAGSLRFSLAIPFKTETLLAEINEVDMDGWILYECFMLPNDTVHYIGWDIGAPAPEWIELDRGALVPYAPQLMKAIISFTTARAGV